MYLKQQKLVTNAARPSLQLISCQTCLEVPEVSTVPTYLIKVGTQDMSNWRLVNGAATDASASDNEIPTSAAFKAPQSFAPSPQKPQQ